MSVKQSVLDVSAFLDSSHAKELSLPEEDIRRAALSFLDSCYDDLGKKPHLMDGEDAHAVLGHCMPGRMKRKDKLADQVPTILRAYLQHLEETEVLSHSFELKRGMEATFKEFQDAVRTGQEAHHGHHEKQDPFVHGAAKLGRNDPCSCGSGKKYKKCHGRGL